MDVLKCAEKKTHQVVILFLGSKVAIKAVSRFDFRILSIMGLCVCVAYSWCASPVIVSKHPWTDGHGSCIHTVFAVLFIYFHACVYGFQNSGDCCNINILLPGISQTLRVLSHRQIAVWHTGAQVVLQDVATKSHPWTEICSLTPGDQRTLRMVRGMSWDVELIYIWRLAISRKSTSTVIDLCIAHLEYESSRIF